ncbi:hypothetical protein, no similarity [Maudiozyma barnettii]|uniref:LIM zinc-binding domain-containing protein n=1 Tax=Maudiozyma barnettii TaxID=61262 RepID=A0A8H2VIY8_9SACH|nr:hypothetical protein, no similarity [Kazachstania barnettii]CAB4256258.1 hypothetical protein, no similarity [Kazachstania barnettii]CAD1784867.1 hypothetical protein, no similarity [Kazachstania barnettii]
MGVLKTSPYPKAQVASLKRAGLQFHFKKIIKRSTIQPKKFSGYFEYENAEDLLPTVEQTSKEHDLPFAYDLFESQENAALRANMGSIIVERDTMEGTPPPSPPLLTMKKMQKNNIFFQTDSNKVDAGLKKDLDGVDSLVDYVTADDHTPITAKGTLVDLSRCILQEGSPLNRKQKTVINENIVPTLMDPTGLTDESITMLDAGMTVEEPTIPFQNFKGYEPIFLDSTESLVANLSQSTVLPEGIQSDISHNTTTTSSSTRSNINDNVEWPTGTGPCRFCHEEIVTTEPFEQNRPKRPIYAEELHGQWHRSCFKCTDCSKTLDRHNQCYVYEDEPYCQLHYHEHNGSLCNICHGIVEGECLENHKNERFHMACMQCYVCNTLITRGYTLINDTIPICKEHNLETLAEQGIFEV